MAGKQYTVVGAMASAKVNTDQGSQLRYFYEGAVLPPEVDDDTIKHLLEVGLVEEVDGSSDSGGAPAKSAAKPEWVDYAVSQGMSRSDAEAATKDDLVEAYGS